MPETFRMWTVARLSLRAILLLRTPAVGLDRGRPESMYRKAVHL